MTMHRVEEASANYISQMNETGNAISKGYKQTEVGVIPEDWCAVKLGDLARIQRGASPRPIDSPIWFDRNSTVGWLRISDVTKTSKYLTETIQSLSELGVAHSRFVSSDNLVMSICATVGKPIITRKDLCIHDGFVVFNGLTANQDYMYYVLKDLEDEWGKQGQTGSQMNLNTDLINGTYIALPLKEEEQTAIANALSDVDTLINGLEKSIAKKQAIKTATMQQLLTGRTRLPQFAEHPDGKLKGHKQTELGEVPEDWNVMALGDVAKINMGQSPSSSNYNNNGIGLPLVQGNADIANRGTIIRNYTSQITKTAQKGDLILSVRAPVGEVAKATFNCCIGRGVCAIKYSNEYLYHWLINFETEWEKFSKGSTFDSINSDELKSILLVVPSDEEQVAIATILTDMDEEIQTLQQRLNKTRQIKQGMMQELLTGKTRLI